MTIADEARDNALHFEGVKAAYRQTKDGVVVSFVVHPHDVPDALATAALGSRYIVALVQVGDDEKPIPPAEKESNPTSPIRTPARPRSDTDRAGAKRDWRDMKPSAQAAIRCGEAIFWAFMNEEHGYNIETKDEAAEAIRDKCGVISRKLLDLEQFHAHRVIWHQLDTSYLAWKALEHA